MRKLFTSLCVVSAIGAYAQTREINGQILDRDTKEPLVGATVFISPNEKGAADYNPQGVIADFDGNFTFSLPKNVKQVVVSYLGYEAITVDISKKEHHVIFLAPAVNELKDIVVTGYQKIEKRKLTSAITKVEAAEIKQIGVGSIDQMLDGQIAGMVSTPANGGPGAPNRIRIRGTASLSGTQDPLWVVDGLPLEGNEVGVDFSDKDNIDNLTNTSIAGLNPDDIADITILKDAAATAIYGARAANGVIVVTTKKGQKGKMKVNFNASTFVTTKPDFDKLNLMNASEKVDFELYMAQRGDMYGRTNMLRGDIARILNANGDLGNYQSQGWGGLSTASQNSINALRQNNVNWFDQAYQTAVNQQYGLSLSGGSDNTNYYVSAGYYDEQGTTKGTGFNRFNLTTNLDFKLGSKVNFGIGLFGNQSTRKSYMSDTDAHTNPGRYTRSVNPYRTVYNADGSYAYDPDIEPVDDKVINYNLAEERANTNYELTNSAVKALFSLEYRVVKGLKLSSQFGMELSKTDTEKLAKENSFFRRKYREYSRYRKSWDDPNDYYMLEDKGGILQNWNETFFQYNWKAQAEYSRTFADKHDMDLMGGVELRRNETSRLHSKAFGYNERTLESQTLVFPTSEMAKDKRFRQFAKDYNENAFISYYGTASYTYDNRYTVFGSIRFDGSNLFGANPKYRYQPLWSASGAWNINREEFMSEVSWLSNLKLRASYGLQGNVDRNTYPVVVGNWQENTIYPGMTEDVIAVLTPPNQNLRWEKTGTTNVGLDFGIFNNRLTGSLEGYYRNSTDLIGTRELAQENGFEFTSMNWARVTNRGFEISLSSRNIITKNFSWSTDFNLSRNISKINDIHVKQNSNEPARKGYPVNALFNIKTAGLDDRGIPQFYNKEGEIVSLEERFKLGLLDFGDGQVLVTSDMEASEYRDLYQYAGDKDPKFSGGLINKFRYKDFDLTISASFNLKQMVQATPSYVIGQIDAGVNYTKDVLNAWRPDNTGSKLPALIGNQGETATAYYWYNSFDSFNTYRQLDIWAKEISYVRINSIRLGYTIPAHVLKGKFIQSCRFNAEARNPFVFGTNYDGYFDPETYGNIYAQPISKSFSVGVNMTF